MIRKHCFMPLFFGSLAIVLGTYASAQSAYTGSLAQFSQGAGDQSAGSWGVAQSSTQSARQNERGSPSERAATSPQDRRPPSENPARQFERTPDNFDGPQFERRERGDGPTQDSRSNPGDQRIRDGGNYQAAAENAGTAASGPSPADYLPLDTGDALYDPITPDLTATQIPSSCAEAGSPCAQCVRNAEGVVQFNRNYLHVAWSVTNDTIRYAEKKVAFGDAVSGMHGAMALSWQLAGKPQIDQALGDLRKTYARKYQIYIGNIQGALRQMSECEQQNFATRDLYERFGFIYLEFLRSRYESAET